MNKITASELRTNLVLYQTRSFTLSGKVLHKVPTAVSYTLNTLEKKLQIKLFNKSNKKLVPTIAGKYLAGKAAQILDEMETTLQNTISLAEDFEPDLKIAVNNIVSLKPLYDLCKLSTKLFPHTQLNLSIEVYNGVWESLFSDRADIAVGAPHSADLNSDLETFRLGVCNWLFCVCPKHPLTAEILPLSNDTLRHYPAVCVKDTSSVLPAKNAWLLKGQQAIFVPDYYSKIRMHENGSGVGFLPEYFAKPFLDSQKLVTLPVKNPKKPTTLWIAVKDRQNRGPAFNWWLEQLKLESTKRAMLSSLW